MGIDKDSPRYEEYLKRQNEKAKERYQRLKSEPAFKEQRRRAAANWRAKNPVRSEAERTRTRERAKEYYQANKDTPEFKEKAFKQRTRYRKLPKAIEAAKAYREVNRRELARYSFEYRLKTIYGLEPEDYARMYEAQNKTCAICSKQLILDRTTHLDHCHETGKVRGLLCEPCNIGIGHLKDKASFARKAYDYLTE